MSWFYIDFNYSFGQGMLFYQQIDRIFERNRAFIIIHHPAKFHLNQSRTFWDNRPTNTHTDTHTHKPMKIIPVQNQRFWTRYLNHEDEVDFVFSKEKQSAPATISSLTCVKRSATIIYFKNDNEILTLICLKFVRVQKLD